MIVEDERRMSKTLSLLRTYRLPDPDEEGLTPYQIAEREACRRRSVFLFYELSMTPESAEEIIHTSLSELQRRCGIDYDLADEMWRAARRYRENLKLAAAELER